MKPAHSKYPVSGVKMGAAQSAPCTGKSPLQRASIDDSNQGVAGAWWYLDLDSPTAGHDAGGTDQGLGPPGLPW